jgi:hypothetical protein
VFPVDPRQLEQQPAPTKEQLYFEVLVVESMTETQERALRKEVRGWRRPDDEFVYELVVVSSGDEALIAARLNVNLQAASLADFSGFHAAFRDPTPPVEPTPEADVRKAFYLAYNDTFCEYLTGTQVDEKLDAGMDVVSATFVTPYPPGFPVLVPGQVFSRQILSFIRGLDTPEIHGYRPDYGYRVYTDKAIEIAAKACAAQPNGQRADRFGTAAR